MLKGTALALTASACLFAAAPAFAADMAAPFVTPAPEYVPPPPAAVGGWYLRGDIGYKVFRDPDVRFNDGVIGSLTSYGSRLDNTADLGLGIGYKFNDWFRADVTADYMFGSHFTGHFPCGCGVGFSDEYARISGFNSLLNVYADLGYWHGITPYVGAGAGFSYLTTSGVGSLNPDGTSDVWRGSSKFQFAWAVMAGLAYQVNSNVTLDLGYRYLNLGDAQSAALPIGTGASSLRYRDLQAHEVRFGVRYMFGGGAGSAF